MATTGTADNYLSGQLQNVIFAAKDSYFKILAVKVLDANFDWEAEDIVVTGSFAAVEAGAQYLFYGGLVRHPKYGQQFQASRYENQLPSDEEGLIAYFASAEFSGIGRKTAERIVSALGASAIQQILDDDSVLEGLIKPKQAQQIAQSLQNKLGLEQLFLLGNQAGWSAEVMGKLYDLYGEEAQQILEAEPYRLVYEFDGLTFAKIDRFAQQNGYEPDDSARIQAGLYAAIANSCFANGHTYLTLPQVYEAVARPLGAVIADDNALIDQALTALVDQELIIKTDDLVQPSWLGRAEKVTGEGLQRLLSERAEVQTSERLVRDSLVTGQGIALDDVQREAVVTALTNQVFVLTGGPGTGKTTVTKTIAATWQALVKKAAKERGRDKDKDWLRAQRVRLASPTGRAAKRMTEVTGFEASTIHRLLGITDTDRPEFDQDDPIGGGLLIIDEASMLDIHLAALLVQALPKGMHLIFVGDADQLPSVGPGNVLFDLIHSGAVAHVALERIYRQGKGSTISMLATAINDGYLPADFRQKQVDRSFFEASAEQVPRAIEQVLRAAQKKGMTAQNVQILAPMYRTSAGVSALNELAQNLWNPEEEAQKSLTYGQKVFRVGDKVLQLENDAERDIYNGDMGQVVGIHYKKEADVGADSLVVDFDGQEVWYTSKTLGQLSLAYATTIHKAQGNEFKLVILVLTRSFTYMLNQNLVYTAITRAKEALVMIGDYGAYAYAAEHPVPLRQTLLKQYLQGQALTEESSGDRSKSANPSLTSEQAQPTSSPASSSQLDAPKPAGLYRDSLPLAMANPLVGMAGLEPTDFL
ncbi:ATP-dependent RecD-like DNA helicase [Leuconostocaceae bacterium ESL0958]|nr:ATP-dependent RecD-like DNA helicase [Leuconostocaceae bacterium ESL0958]